VLWTLPHVSKINGLYHAAIALSALPACLLFGLFWARLGATRTFWIGASLAMGVLLILTIFLSTHEKPPAVESQAHS